MQLLYCLNQFAEAPYRSADTGYHDHGLKRDRVKVESKS